MQVLRTERHLLRQAELVEGVDSGDESDGDLAGNAQQLHLQAGAQASVVSGDK